MNNIFLNIRASKKNTEISMFSIHLMNDRIDRIFPFILGCFFSSRQLCFNWKMLNLAAVPFGARRFRQEGLKNEANFAWVVAVAKWLYRSQNLVLGRLEGTSQFSCLGWVGRMILTCNDFQYRDFPAVCLKKIQKRCLVHDKGMLMDNLEDHLS